MRRMSLRGPGRGGRGLKMPCGIERALQLARGCARSGGASGVEARRPRLSRPREQRRMAADARPRLAQPASPAARCASQRWPPCHSISCVAGEAEQRRGLRQRQAPEVASWRSIASLAATKNSSRWSRRPCQNGAAAAASIALAAELRARRLDRGRARRAGAATQRRRLHQALALSGSGWPPQALSAAQRLGLASCRSAASPRPAAIGSTLSDDLDDRRRACRASRRAGARRRSRRRSSSPGRRSAAARRVPLSSVTPST